MSDKDYSLLRPFDLEAAKRGEEICLNGTAESATYIAGPDKGANIVCDVDGYFKEYFHTALRMKPICLVEGRPVYKGDVLWHKVAGRMTILATYAGSKENDLQTDGGLCHSINLSWVRPKVKREGWVNIYPKTTGNHLALVSRALATKQEADEWASVGRIACIRIEWEE